MADRLGTQVGNYRLMGLLGQGGFAEVYLGEHIHLGTQAAIKLLHAPLASAGEVEKFRQEARLIATLQHPHILRVLDFGIEAGQPYLVLEHAPGGSLRERHPSGTQVPLVTVVSYVQQIAQALQYAHDQKLIHRDIKPQNLLVGRNGEFLLSDFGISVVAESTSRQQVQGFAGTVAYSAPEQLQEHPRPASDQYALGIVIYEWLSGHLPFTGALGEVAAKHLFAAPPSLCVQLPTLPPAVEEVVFTALAKDPKDRFATVQAFARALMQASQTATTQPFVPASPTPVVLPPQIAPTPETVNEATPPASSTPVLPPVAQAAPAPVSASSLQTPTEQALAASLASPVRPAPVEERTEQAWNPPTPHSLAPTFEKSVPVPAPDLGKVRGSVLKSKTLNGRTLLLLVLLLCVLVGSGLAVLEQNNVGFFASNLPPTATPLPPGVVTEFSLSPNTSPFDITAGPDGNLWFTEFKSNQIGRITPDGQITEFPVHTPKSDPWGITAGPDGNLWFTEEAGKIGRITPEGTITEYPVPTVSFLDWITAGPDGNLWFTASGSLNKIGRITTGGTITEFPLPRAQGSFSLEMATTPEGIAANGSQIEHTPSVRTVPASGGDPYGGITAGPDGNLWFTEAFDKKIVRITPGGMVTEFPLPNSQSIPVGITAGPDGNLWFTEGYDSKIARITPGGKITEIPLPSSRRFLGDITSGPDGNLWFTEPDDNQIGRITPGGVITEFPLPLPQNGAGSLSAGPDRNLWFTQADQIGRITTGK